MVTYTARAGITIEILNAFNDRHFFSGANTIGRKFRFLLSTLPAVLISLTAHAASTPHGQLASAVASPSRSEAARARDVFRHPLETLTFFGIRPNQSVVEITPSGGWYTDILAPYLHDKGKYYAAGPAADPARPDAQSNKTIAAFQAKLAADPKRFDRVIVTEFSLPSKTEIAPPGSADLVLTFRNVHNWISAGTEDAAFAAFYTALKPGGVLGVVEHQASPGTTEDVMKKSGYVTEAFVKLLALKAGFNFAGESEINANPKDNHDHPAGVWTLPPTLQLGDQDRADYEAIGESDRMTLKFVKP